MAGKGNGTAVRKAPRGSQTSVAPTRVRPYEKTGFSGTAVTAGVVQVKEKDFNLVGSQKWKNFSEILVNTAIVAASVRYFLNLIAQATWTAKPANESPEAAEYAELALDYLHDMETPWSRVVKRTAMYRLNGYSLQEWTAKRRADGRVGFKDVEARPCHTIVEWDVDPTGDMHGVVQESPWDYRRVYLPRAKLVYAVDDTLSDDPEGVGLLRQVYPHSKMLKDYELAESRGFATDLRGVPLLRLPMRVLQDMKQRGELKKDEYDSIMATMRGFIDNHIRGESTGLLFDSQPYTSMDSAATPGSTPHWDAELLKGEGGPFDDLANAIQRKLFDIARMFGTEHLLMGSTSAGSFAQAKSKTENFFLNVDGTLADLASTYERDLLGAMWKLNGWPDEMKPDLQAEKVRFKDVEQVTAALRDMAQAGAMLAVDDPAIGEVRDLLGLSRPSLVEAEYDASLAPRPSEGEPDGDIGEE